VSYWRADRNRGAVWNFNRVFELSSGKYFMWAAHDDRREPSFVSACVEHLERCPGAVLCQAQTLVSIEGDDRDVPLCVATLDTFEDKEDVVARYRETLQRVPATAVYGLFRSSAVRATQMLSAVMGADLAFVQELSIHGSFIQVPLPLHQYVGRKSWNTVDQDARAFLGIARKPWWYLPFAALFFNHCKRVTGAPLSVWTKACLLGVLTLHEARQAGVKVALKVAGALCPARQRKEWALALYRRWLDNPNIRVIAPDLFFERVCKPRLGWWR
jgi:hypothetical protein